MIAGQLLLEFDQQAIAAAGYLLTTPIVVTNLAAGQEIEVIASGDVVAGEPLFTVQAKGVSSH